MQKRNKHGLAVNSDFGMDPASEKIPKSGNQKVFVVKNTETVIWKKLIDGDESALGDLYNIYVDCLFSYGINCTKDRTYVMDCIHDLFVDLYKYRENLSMTDNVKYYLFRSLKRKINRKYATKTISVTEEYQYSLNEQTRNYTTSCEEEIIKKERLTEKRMVLANALESLTKKQRRGLFLRFNQDKSYEEISEIMEVSVQTARTIVYRALKALR
ncbi:RNA polymerase sigma factor [Maribacter litoralis]|uniref:Sigma-70 family RNA polymerase sigma factor n=1 Tax=Maribacter litoralis TaxID=2059726 RepID=A0A653W3I3_9FLAO|nr:sigma-70 family RNA polymerase sigma factor [Maribacter litoralis]VXC13438.1 Sigma-70 family RNA polymerase sigma factor [Maribacter litoralis]